MWTTIVLISGMSVAHAVDKPCLFLLLLDEVASFCVALALSRLFSEARQSRHTQRSQADAFLSDALPLH